jgi:ABC-type multidrug transport system ATPase subunit
MNNLSQPLKKKLFQKLFERPDFLGIYSDYDGIITFLNKIWPLQDMPSEDSRFANAMEDARQHLVNNSDWEYDYTFTERLNLLGGPDEIFNTFLEVVVSPDVRKDKDSILEYVNLINYQLARSGHRMVHVDYFEELPVYKLADKGKFNDLPLEISANQIPFFKGMDGIDQYPCFVLIYDNWDDYGHKTTMALQYRSSQGSYERIGELCIMKSAEKTTWDVLPDRFIQLEEDFCSLGSGIEFYETFRTVFGANYQSALYALRDVALFPRIADEFEDDDIFRTSLLRMNEAESLMRTARFKMNGIDLSQAFKFNFSTRPPYAENDILLNFDFQYAEKIKHRIYGLIGKNGTGKTRILSSLIHALSEDNPTSITPKKPLYGKIFSVSYSFFDRFEIPDANASFNYVYCGLKKKDNGWLSEEELTARFFESADRIKKKNLVVEWNEILKTFIPGDILGEMYGRKDGQFSFLAEKFSSVYNKVSSGQNILLFIITEVIAQIRQNSLIIYDEPETHLHPNAISELMNTLFTMTENFNSFCILATHSPIVIQELQSRNVYVIEREDLAVSARKLDKEVFAENLTVITEDIFGNREVSKHYIQFLRGLVTEDMTFEEIVSTLETNDLPLSLNARLYIKSLISEHNENA